MKKLALIFALISTPAAADCGLNATYTGQGSYEAFFGVTLDEVVAPQVEKFCRCKGYNDFSLAGGLMGSRDFVCLGDGDVAVPANPGMMPIVPVIPF